MTSSRPSAEKIAKLTEFANKLVWKKSNLDVLRPELAGHYSPLAETMQAHIKSSDRRQRLVLPDLRAFGASRC
jgi:hypothetical protein